MVGVRTSLSRLLRAFTGGLGWTDYTVPSQLRPLLSSLSRGLLPSNALYGTGMRWNVRVVLQQALSRYESALRGCLYCRAVGRVMRGDGLKKAAE